MDATVASGAAAMMAIRILLDHEVPEENIMLCSLLMAVSGVHSIAYAFPRVLMITTEVDPEVNDKFYILPGIGREEISLRRERFSPHRPPFFFSHTGNYGDRYFGTESYD